MKPTDLKKIIKEELKNIIAENSYVVVDPRGNARPVGSKMQGSQYSKKMGGPRKGYHIVLAKNALKARRAIEKNGGNSTNSKIQNLMFDLMYEGKLTEGKRISFRDMGIKNLMDLKLYTDKLAKANIGWDQKGQALVFNNTNDAKKARQLLGLDEGKLTEALARGLKPLLTVGAKITSKVGEKVLLKLSDKFDDIDDEQADDIASHLNMGIELMQDRSPSEARGWFKKFNKVCKDALSGKSVKSAMEGVSEGKLNESKQYKDVSNKFKNALDVMPEKYFNKKGVIALIKKLKEKNPEAAMAYTMEAFGWMSGMKESITVNEHQIDFTKEEMATLHNNGKLVKKDAEGKEHTYTFKS